MQFKNLLQGKIRVYVQNETSRTHFEGFSPIAPKKTKNAEGERIEVYLKEILDLQPKELRLSEC